MFEYAPVKILNRIRLILSLLSPFILIYYDHVSYTDGCTFIESAERMFNSLEWHLLWFIPACFGSMYMISYPLVYLVLIWDRSPFVVAELSSASIIPALVLFLPPIAFLFLVPVIFFEMWAYYFIPGLTFLLLHFYLFWLYFKLNRVEYNSSNYRDNKFTFCGCSVRFEFAYGSPLSSRVRYNWQLNNGSGWVDLFEAGQFSGTNSSKLTINNIDLNQNNSIVRCLIREKYLTKATKEFRLFIPSEKDEILEIIKNDGFYNYFDLLVNAPDQFKNDREIVFEVIKKNALSLGCASEIFKNDRELVLQAVKQEAMVITYASEELQQDKSFVLEAVKINNKALKYVYNELRLDPDIQAAAN